MKRVILALIACVPLMAAEVDWKTTHSLKGNCQVAFPTAPEHMRQQMPLPEGGGTLKYDVYVSGLEKEAVFMVLIAEYPSLIGNQYAEMSLEGFLNGILTQNPKNKLLFADLIEVDGHKALDFFIQTGEVYFKGRAIMANNSLYLLAMECDETKYVEDHYLQFISSFSFN